MRPLQYHVSHWVLPDKWEVWLERSGVALPCKSVVTSADKTLVQTNEYNWNLNSTLSPEHSLFSPPDGSQKVEIGDLGCSRPIEHRDGGTKRWYTAIRRARAAIVGRQSDAGDVIFWQPVGHVERKRQLVRSEPPAESITVALIPNQVNNEYLGSNHV